MQQGWRSIKSAVTGADDKHLIAECERAEDTARKDYEEALKQDLPAEVRALLARQFASVRDAHGRIHALHGAVP